MLKIQPANLYRRRISQSLGNTDQIRLLSGCLCCCAMQNSESAAVNLASWLSSLIPAYLRRRTKCLLLPAAPRSHRIAGQAGSGSSQLLAGSPAERWNWPLQGWSERSPHSRRGHSAQSERTRCWAPADIPISTYRRFGRSAGHSQVLYAARSCREAQPCQAIPGCGATLLPTLVF